MAAKGTSWRTGTAVNLALLAVTLVYLLLVSRHALGTPLTAFGRNWSADGFCLSFKGTLLHSHLLCFYTDTLWAIVLHILPKYGRPELDLVQENAGSVFGHGVGHLLLWALGAVTNPNYP